MSKFQHEFIIDKKGRMLLENANIILGALIDKNKELQQIIDKAIEYIREYCIDDEFFINLTNKEKCIFDVLEILKEAKNNEKKDDTAR